MILRDHYYHIARRRLTETGALVGLSILPDCTVYRGHFPQRPVCPGACNMEMLRELAEELTGERLQVARIKRCRFLKVVTPDGSPQLDVEMHAKPTDTGFHVEATIKEGNELVADYNAELTKL